MGSPDKIKIDWNDHNAHVVSTVKSLRNDSTFSDVTLVCENSQVEAHRVILASFSFFFSRILHEQPDPHPLIYLSGVKMKDMMKVLDYMYSGQVDMVFQDVDTFLENINELEIKGCDFTTTSATTSKSPATESSESPGGSTVITEDSPVDYQMQTDSIPEDNQTETSTEDNQVNFPIPATWISQDVIDDMMLKSEPNVSDGNDNPFSNEGNEIPFPVDFQKKKQMKCKECPYITDCKSNLTRHIDAKHLQGPLPRTYVCHWPQCHKILTSDRARRDHVKKEHYGK